jgi:hypothetical protein
MRRMVVIVPMLTGYAMLRHIEVPLAHVPALVDGVKYMEPRDVPRLKGSELRRRAHRRCASWSSWRCDANRRKSWARNCAGATSVNGSAGASRPAAPLRLRQAIK